MLTFPALPLLVGRLVPRSVVRMLLTEFLASDSDGGMEKPADSDEGSRGRPSGTSLSSRGIDTLPSPVR
jgi:hypothetical protein